MTILVQDLYKKEVRPQHRVVRLASARNTLFRRWLSYVAKVTQRIEEGFGVPK